MELTIENSVAYTSYLLHEYYHHNLIPFFSVLSEDAMWIDPGNVFLFGKAAIQSCFEDGFVMPVMEIGDEEFYCIWREETGCTVVGKYTAQSSRDAEVICAQRQRTTFQYRTVNGRLELVHLHVSNEWSELVGDEYFPVKVGKQTYQYVQKILQENKHQTTGRRIILNTESGVSFIEPDTVLFIEAAGQNSVVHYIDKSITVKKILGELIGEFPGYFYRSHRSYLVNCNYILGIERYMITLINGSVIPIPEKRYLTVRDEIITIMEQHEEH